VNTTEHSLPKSQLDGLSVSQDLEQVLQSASLWEAARSDEVMAEYLSVCIIGPVTDARYVRKKRDMLARLQKDANCDCYLLEDECPKWGAVSTSVRGDVLETLQDSQLVLVLDASLEVHDILEQLSQYPELAERTYVIAPNRVRKTRHGMLLRSGTTTEVNFMSEDSIRECNAAQASCVKALDVKSQKLTWSVTRRLLKEKDRRWQKRFTLAADLSTAGARVWVDDAEMLVGDELIPKIRQAIDEMDYLGVVLSPDSVASEWVKREVDVAMNQEIAGRRVKVLPILWRDCTIPSFLPGKLFADFRTPSNYGPAFDMILARLGLPTP
jgi:hypothetical protein